VIPDAGTGQGDPSRTSLWCQVPGREDVTFILKRCQVPAWVAVSFVFMRARMDSVQGCPRKVTGAVSRLGPTRRSPSRQGLVDRLLSDRSSQRGQQGRRRAGSRVSGIRYRVWGRSRPVWASTSRIEPSLPRLSCLPRAESRGSVVEGSCANRRFHADPVVPLGRGVCQEWPTSSGPLVTAGLPRYSRVTRGRVRAHPETRLSLPEGGHRHALTRPSAICIQQSARKQSI